MGGCVGWCLDQRLTLAVRIAHEGMGLKYAAELGSAWTGLRPVPTRMRLDRRDSRYTASRILDSSPVESKRSLSDS